MTQDHWELDMRPKILTHFASQMADNKISALCRRCKNCGPKVNSRNLWFIYIHIILAYLCQKINLISLLFDFVLPCGRPTMQCIMQETSSQWLSQPVRRRWSTFAGPSRNASVSRAPVMWWHTLWPSSLCWGACRRIFIITVRLNVCDNSTGPLIYATIFVTISLTVF